VEAVSYIGVTLIDDGVATSLSSREGGRKPGGSGADNLDH
jgi:hypothetical protein